MMNKLLLLVCLFLPFHLFGSDRITVLEFNTSGVSESEMLIFIDFIASEITNMDQYILIDRRQREQVLNELSFSNSGCTDESCQLEIGKLLSANFIVVGSLGSLGSSYILNMQLVEVVTGESVETISHKYSNLDDLVNDSRGLMISLLDGTSPPRNEPSVTENKQDPSPQPAMERSFQPSVIGSRKTIFSTLYNYEGKLYDSFTSYKIAETMMKTIPNTTANRNLFNEYKEQYDSGKSIVNIGIGIALGGLVIELLGLFSETDGLTIGGVAGVMGGLVLQIIGGKTLGSAHDKFGELVKIYNFSL